MNRTETGQLLAVVAGCDQREASQMSVLSWHEILADIPIEEARAAVPIHYGRTRDWLMPSDIVAIVKAERDRRSREGRKQRQIEAVRAIETSAEANRNARLSRIKACKGCDDKGRLLDGRFCSHDLEGL